MNLGTPEAIFAIAALVLLLSIIAVRLSRRLGMPSLLLYLGIGLVLGVDTFGIDLDNTLLTEHLGFVALVFILAEGGLTTRWSNVRPALGLGISLATVSVVVSVAIAGAGVFLLMGFDWRTSLLWGAVLSSTDAAAVFSVLRGVGVKPRLSAALELESGLNDAPVVIAVVLLAGTAEITWLDPLLVVYELVVGALIGAGIGWGGAWLMRREALPAAGLYPLATIALIGGAYAVGVFTHASGFLACYVAAVVLGNSRIPHRSATLSFAEGLGWLAQIGLFVMLGLYVDPTGLPAALVPGLLIGLFVLLVARPVSVVAAALPFRLPWREQIFLSWSGLRGAVPIVLAMIPLMNGVEYSSLLLDVIVVVVVTYTLLQGTTLPWLARKLGVVQSGQAFEIEMEAAPLDEMNAHVLQVTIPEKSKMHGVYVAQLRLPMPATISLLMRNGEPVHLNPNIRLQSGDQLLVIAPERVRAATERRLRAVGRGGALANWFGERGERSD
ncbi:potassium/proton antiporter [Nakamurella multipartita]|uniref:Sodium/hydrogen exchanger n=1 Tax=Nakamurella multipartita (strain ATCC 700099 / DSM 44233 / CIP 104796 / JCM 9543 / NBRC 105858 / Y-104) TaxID=479431 RepID=C8XCS6_NAKMY|nr:potassium/proton antiporter [Nakamurella multipartita]ACV79529.1 sodium/hydrogen exchanger [Nakamurella multipartita DSM 44233]